MPLKIIEIYRFVATKSKALLRQEIKSETLKAFFGCQFRIDLIITVCVLTI